jgi:hypothetical protein
LVFLGLVSTAVFMTPYRRVEQLPGSLQWKDIYEFGLRTPWLQQVKQFNPQQSWNKFQPWTVSFVCGLISAGVWLAFWIKVRAEQIAGKDLAIEDQVFAPRPSVGPDGKQRINWLRVIGFCGLLLATGTTIMGLTAAVMLIVLGDAPPLLMMLVMGCFPMMAIAVPGIIRWAHPKYPPSGSPPVSPIV